jgi:trehalose synthase
MSQRYQLTEVHLPELDPRRLAPLVGDGRVERLEAEAARVRSLLDGRRVINLSSTAHGGGVAEILHTLLGYVRHLGIETAWFVIEGDADFFQITKRIHNGLYGGPGDGLALDAAARATYEDVLDRNRLSLLASVRPDDVVVVHDPQPAGLIPSLLEVGARVVWRCHVGIDGENEWSTRAWSFVRPYVDDAHGFVFSRAGFAPEWIARDRLAVIAPSIDPFTPKNVDLPDDEVIALLSGAGLVAPNGRSRRVRPAHVVGEGAAPDLNDPLVVQVSRWDRMKDMPGVLEAFVEGVPASSPARLVLAGPAVDGVDDDPEARAVWDETVAIWGSLAAQERARVRLALLPMEDDEENALIVNALQRHAAVVVQKSIAEGFGLTVAEAMWKSRPVVASAVGGIADQIEDEESGLLVAPDDLSGLGERITNLLESPEEAERLGANARRRVTSHFLPDRHLLQYAELLEHVLAGQPLA